jgi:hypothetical protein
MTTTLPASKVSGLLRNGSPVSLTSAVWIHATGVIRETDGKLYACMVVDTGGSFLPVLVKDPDPYELVLDDPTGFGHALLYLAKHYRLPSVNGLLWRRIRVTGGAYKGWCLENGQGEVRIPNLDVDDPVEALRLAVLAVAGVQV